MTSPFLGSLNKMTLGLQRKNGLHYPLGIDKLYTRLTFVCYLRENLIKCSDTIDPRFLTKSGHAKIK